MYPCRVFSRCWARLEEGGKAAGKAGSSGILVVVVGSKRVQVKGRVAWGSPLARFTPPGKAVRELHPAPGKFLLGNRGGWQGSLAGYWGEKQGGFDNTSRKEALMGGNADKTKFSIRVDTELVALADAYIKDSTVRNRTELIEDALRFYLGFLTSGKAEDYLLQAISSVMTGTVQDSENRLARMDFKVAVELSKLSQVIAYTHDVDEEAMKRLHSKCVDEVRRINGAIDFENAYKYQKRES